MERVKKVYIKFKYSPIFRILLISLILSVILYIPLITTVMISKFSGDTRAERLQTENIASDLKLILREHTDHDAGEQQMRQVFSHYEIFRGDTFKILNNQGEVHFEGTSKVLSYINSPLIEFLANIVAKIETDEYQKDWIAPVEVYINKNNGHYIYKSMHRVEHNDHYDLVIIERDLTELYAKTIRNGIVHGAMTGIFIFTVVVLVCLLLTRSQQKLFKRVIDEQQRVIEEGSERTNIGRKYNKILGEISDIIIGLNTQVSEIHTTNKNILQDVSHETASCLMEIKQSVDLIRYYGVEDEEKVEGLLKRVDGAVYKINAIQGAFTDLAKVEDTKTLSPPSSYPVQELINYSIKQANGEHPTMEFVQADTGAEKVLQIYREHFLIIMRILLGNAAKYSINSNQVVTSVVEDSRYRDKIAVKVTNWGVYIPEGERERIFERYYRGRNVRNISGVGLGLHIVKKLLKMYNGEIVIDSNPSGETSFIVIFPKIDEKRY